MTLFDYGTTILESAWRRTRDTRMMPTVFSAVSRWQAESGSWVEARTIVYISGTFKLEKWFKSWRATLVCSPWTHWSSSTLVIARERGMVTRDHSLILFFFTGYRCCFVHRMPSDAKHHCIRSNWQGQDGQDLGRQFQRMIPFRNIVETNPRLNFYRTLDISSLILPNQILCEYCWMQTDQKKRRGLWTNVSCHDRYQSS